MSTYAVVEETTWAADAAMPHGRQATVTFLEVGTGRPVQVVLDEDQVDELVRQLTAGTECPECLYSYDDPDEGCDACASKKVTP